MRNIDLPNYGVVIPAKNEEDGIIQTLNSVLNQTHLPKICLVVDDGSTDQTADLVRRFMESNETVELVSIKSDDSYQLGGHVVSVFEEGVKRIRQRNVMVDYFVKLDADISFDEKFVEKIFEKVKGGNYAVFSGSPFSVEKGKRVFSYSPSWHSQGQFKFYNTEFLNQLGSIPKSLGWDCADNIIAIEMGWSTAAFKDVVYEMSRRVGGKFSLTTGRSKHGIGCYVLGYDPIYVCLRGLHDVFKPPFLFGAISVFYGYISAVLTRRKVILNSAQRTILRKLLWGSLTERIKNREFEALQKISPDRKN